MIIRFNQTIKFTLVGSNTDYYTSYRVPHTSYRFGPEYLFYNNIFFDTKLLEKPIRLIGPGIIFPRFPVPVPKTLPLAINVSLQSSLPGTLRARKFQVIPVIEFVQFESEFIHLTVFPGRT